MNYDIDKAIGAKIREYRIMSGMSQMELADKIGVSYQQVQKYEKGHGNISVKRLKQIADIFGVSITDFFPNPSVSDNKAPYDLSKEDLEISKFLSSIKKKEVKRTIKKLLELLSDY